MKLYNCDCNFQETGSGTEEVKGYALVTECDVCKAKRELQAEETAKLQRKQEIVNELNELDRKVIRPLLDGETDRVDTIKAQKLALREELRVLG